MKRKAAPAFIAVLALWALLFTMTPSGPAWAALSAVGPVDPDNGFPQWYQDENALALGPCLEANRFCPLPLPGEQFGFNPFNPIVFPDNFPIEFAYFVVEAFTGEILNSPLRVYEVVLEGGFLNEFTVVDGDQIVAVRLRIRVDIPVDAVSPADYAVTHPYGVEVFRNVPAGGRILVDTAASGPLPVPLDFNTVLGEIVGPFLESADPVNANTLDPLTGNIYLMDPLIRGGVPVTGSPFGTNFVSVDRVTLNPDNTIAGVLENIDFTDRFILFGKKTATVDATPPALVFPEQNVAPVAGVLTVTVTNRSPLRTPSFGQITVAGPNAPDFTVPAGTDDCSDIQLDPQESCTFDVQFSGAADGLARSAMIIIPSNAGEFSPLTVPVSGAIDSIPPIVTAVFPENGGFAPANMMVIAQFEDNLDPATVNGTTFTVETPAGLVAGGVTYDDGSRIAVFTPGVPLEEGVVHTARIFGVPGGVTDNVGNELQADFTWSFTGSPPDLTPPFVTSSSPADGSGGFPTSSPLGVTFNEPMLSFTINEGTFLLDTATGPVAGAVSFDLATDTAVFTPLSPLVFGTGHTLTVTGARDLAGNPAPDFVATFVTNFRPEPPELLSPLNGAAGVARPVTLTWGVPADPDGDPLQFRVRICNNASFIGAGPDCRQDIIVTASVRSATDSMFAGLGFLGLTFGLAGTVLVGGRRSRSLMIAALLTVALMASVSLYSCGGGSGGGGTAPAAGTASTQVAGLSAGVTFFWQVEADDGKGGTEVSDVFTFSTQ